MNLFRLLLIALAVWIIITLLRSRRKRQDALKKQQGSQNIGKIVPCEICGTHIPENEALHHAGKVYCSPEHRDQST